MSRPRVPEPDAAARRATPRAPTRCAPARCRMVRGAAAAPGRTVQCPRSGRRRARRAARRPSAPCCSAACTACASAPTWKARRRASQIGEAQIRERLEIIRPHTRWVRSFSCTDGHEQTPRIAHELGLKTLVGAWLGTDAEINEREIAGRDRGRARRPCRHRGRGQRGAAARGHGRRRVAGLHPARQGRPCPACRWAMSTPTTCSRSTRASPPPATWC